MGLARRIILNVERTSVNSLYRRIMIYKKFLNAISNRVKRKFEIEKALELYRKQGETSNAYKKVSVRHDRIGSVLMRTTRDVGIEIHDVLEIGGRQNPYNGLFPSGSKYLNMDISKTGKNVVVGDITNCPQIPDNSFDLVLSVDVFEHINKPWKAAEEITRILRPGGLAFHSTIFSWRYHPCPQDFFRYSPDGMKSLFCDLECILAEFDVTERRRNILGKDSNKLKSDAFGGWRENWRVNYAGIKKKEK